MNRLKASLQRRWLYLLYGQLDCKESAEMRGTIESISATPLARLLFESAEMKGTIESISATPLARLDCVSAEMRGRLESFRHHI